MKHILKYYLPLCILLLSCDSRDNIKRQYEQLTSDTISLCLNQMMSVSYDGDDILQVKTNCMSNCAKKMVVFADTSLCTTCYIKQMPNWYNLIDSVKRGYGDSVEFCFILISATLYFNVFYKYLSNKKLLRILPCQKFHLS